MNKTGRFLEKDFFRNRPEDPSSGQSSNGVLLSSNFRYFFEFKKYIFFSSLFYLLVYEYLRINSQIKKNEEKH